MQKYTLNSIVQNENLPGHIVSLQYFSAATKQLYEWFSLPARPSARIMKFSGDINIDRSDVHAKGQSSRSPQ